MKNKEVKKNHFLTYTLIITCMLIFLIEAYFVYVEKIDINILFKTYGFSLQALKEGRWWTIFTSIFLHANPEHLFLNMIALFFFGKVIEESMGKFKMLLIFFATGIAGDLALAASAFFNLMSTEIPAIGASAAIFGLMGTAMLVKPFEMIFFPYMVPVPVLLIAFIYTIYNIISFSAVILTGSETDVAYIAHLGGIILGAIIGFKHEGYKKGLFILILIFIMLILLPSLFSLINLLSNFSYIQIFK